MVVFPEGTTTSGRYLLRFKKGAFFALLPIKPVVINSFFEDESQTVVGASNLHYNWLKILTYFRTRMFFAELPIIRLPVKPLQL